MSKRDSGNPGRQRLPIARKEDVEFSAEAADQDDLEAVERAEEADQRAEEPEGR